MLPFSSALKLYLFKNQDKVSLSIKVSDSCVNGYYFNVKDFESIIQNWQQPKGFELQTADGRWFFQYKRSTPRPESANASYVRISVHPHGPMTHHYRVDFSDMINLEKDYFYQKHNVMYWDNDV